jgi:succinate dehydrogenase / fumarate reductase cytochrome b subunit
MKSKQEIYDNRPTSPHLTIYKKQISSVLSIFHRMTGVGLFFGLIIVMWWFILLVFSRFDPHYLQLAKLWVVKPFLFLISYAVFYHLCTGVRHLIWDIGIGFSVPSINFSGWVAVISSVVLTVVFWIYFVG